MNWKEFLKPSEGKIILAALIFAILPVFAYQVQILCDMKMGGYCPPYEIHFISLLGFVFAGTVFMKYLDALTILLIPLGIVISYLISSYKIRKISSITPEDRASFREFLRITRGRIVIFILGLIPILYVALGFMAGMYGGTYQSPPLLSSIFSLLGNLAIIIFPVSMFIIWALVPGNIILIHSIVAFSGFSDYISGNISTQFGFISPGVAVLVVLLLLIEWYLISCLIVRGYNKWKGRK